MSIAYRSQLIGLMRRGASSGHSRLALEQAARDWLSENHDTLELLASDTEREAARKNLLGWLEKRVDRGRE